MTDLAAGLLPQLDGGRCGACDLVFFPYQAHGCDRCGATGEQLHPLPLDCIGTVEGAAVVNRRLADGGPIPVGEIRLRAGVLIRAVLVDDLDIGTAVSARTAATTPGGVVFHPAEVAP